MDLVAVDLDRWRALAARLGLPLPDVAGDALIAAYLEPHRRYHTLGHLSACCMWLDRVRPHCDRPDEIECALWFHDAIYDVRARDNERRSADLATEVLTAAGAPPELVARVDALIMATVHGAESLGGDTAWMVDIDLSILGAPTDVYDAFESQIREEYAWVPEDLFREKRAEILRGFLDRIAVFTQPPMRERLEEQARRNLTRAIAALTSK